MVELNVTGGTVPLGDLGLRTPNLVGNAEIVDATAGAGLRAADIVVRVDDIDETVARLRAAGIEVTDPADQEWGARHAWLHDADGRPVSIYTPTEPPGG